MASLKSTGAKSSGAQSSGAQSIGAKSRRKAEWVVVCDGAKALLLANRGSRIRPRLTTVEVYEQDVPKSAEIGTDRPGRTFQSVGAMRSAKEETDWHEQNEQRFLADLAARLDQAIISGEAASLVIVAAPRALGVLRSSFSDHVRQAVRAEIDKDLVKAPMSEIEQQIVP